MDRTKLTEWRDMLLIAVICVAAVWWTVGHVVEYRGLQAAVAQLQAQNQQVVQQANAEIARLRKLAGE